MVRRCAIVLFLLFLGVTYVTGCVANAVRAEL